MTISSKREVSPISLWQGNEIADSWLFQELAEYASNIEKVIPTSRFNIATGSFTLPTPTGSVIGVEANYYKVNIGFPATSIIYYFSDATASPAQYSIGLAAALNARHTQPECFLYIGNLDSDTATIETNNTLYSSVSARFFTTANGFEYFNTTTPPANGGDTIKYIAFGE